MPIATACPGCKSRLNAPDAAAGKRVKCPKCATVIEVPAPVLDVEVVNEKFEIVEDSAAKDKELVTEIPRRRNRDRDFDDDDRPRSSQRGARSKDPPQISADRLELR